MGSVKQTTLEGLDQAYERNRHHHQVRELRRLMKLYADRPSFVAKLQHELNDLKEKRGKW